MLFLCFWMLISLQYACKKKGCTDELALNHNMAEIDDGSCQFSRSVFYKSADNFNGDAISRIEIYGNHPKEASRLLSGSIDRIYAAGELNCSSPGTATYDFEDSRKFEWNALIFTAANDSVATYVKSGVIEPSSSIECIRIDIIK
ncbi:MAG: hypothetical protein AAFV25_01360 [Bacteroidota bacterium]